MPNGHVQPLPVAWDTRSSADGGQRWYHLYPDEYIAQENLTMIVHFWRQLPKGARAGTVATLDTNIADFTGCTVLVDS